MRRGLTGTYEYSIAGGDTCQAFVPLPLPPRPALSLDADLQERLNAAHLALGRLDGLSLLMPETSVLLYSYVRKEAVMSSRIEGTQSSLADLLIYDTQFTKDEYLQRPHWGHSHPDDAIAIARDAKVKRLCLFHHAPMRSDDDNDAILARYRDVVHQQGDTFELVSAYEGLEIALGDA